jgi:hypothetical protein
MSTVTRARVYDIYLAIEKLQQELMVLRENCSHPSHTVAYFQWAEGHFTVKQICDICDNPLGDPTPEELEEFDDVLNTDSKWTLNKMETQGAIEIPTP